jgi:hypothetical protein
VVIVPYVPAIGARLAPTVSHCPDSLPCAKGGGPPNGGGGIVADTVGVVPPQVCRHSYERAGAETRPYGPAVGFAVIVKSGRCGHRPLQILLRLDSIRRGGPLRPPIPITPSRAIGDALARSHPTILLICPPHHRLVAFFTGQNPQYALYST